MSKCNCWCGSRNPCSTHSSAANSPGDEQAPGVPIGDAPQVVASQPESAEVLTHPDQSPATGQQAAGVQATGEQGAGEQAAGERSTGGQAPGGQAPGGQTPGGQTPGGQTPGGQAPGGQAPGEQATRGQETGTKPGSSPNPLRSRDAYARFRTDESIDEDPQINFRDQKLDVAKALLNDPTIDEGLRRRQQPERDFKGDFSAMESGAQSTESETSEDTSTSNQSNAGGKPALGTAQLALAGNLLGGIALGLGTSSTVDKDSSAATSSSSQETTDQPRSVGEVAEPEVMEMDRQAQDGESRQHEQSETEEPSARNPATEKL